VPAVAALLLDAGAPLHAEADQETVTAAAETAAAAYAATEAGKADADAEAVATEVCKGSRRVLLQRETS